jgi:hypothetical protein
MQRRGITSLGVPYQGGNDDYAGQETTFIYMIIGLFVYFVMRAMGELLLSNLNFKSFADFAGACLGPRAAFFLGWSYWLSWSVAVVGDAVVVGGFFQYWFPDVPAWIPAIDMLLMLFALNVLTVRLFGEVEFWLQAFQRFAVRPGLEVRVRYAPLQPIQLPHGGAGTNLDSIHCLKATTTAVGNLADGLTR